MIINRELSMCLVAALLSVSCATPARYLVKSDPPIVQESNEYFETSLKPRCGSSGCDGFRLTIQNKTDKNLEVNWNKTVYINHGQTSGGFMFEGVVYRDRNNPKAPDIVFGNGTFSKTIWPNNLVEYTSGKYGGWSNEDMPSGENGVYLTVNIDGKEISQKLVTSISVTRIEQ